MAVGGDGASEPADDVGGLAALRERNVDLPAASPWLPRKRWQLVLIAATFWLGLIAAAVLLIQPVPPHPQLEPAINHLVSGPRPVLATYADILLWMMAAQMAGLVGWYRSHSQLDFHGRYRLWAWAALVFAAWSFCAGTGIHTAIGAVAGPRLRWPIWRAEIVVWLAPAMAAGLSVWWVIKGDLRRWRVSRTLIQLSVCVLLVTGAALLYQPDMTEFAWYAGAIVAGQFLGMGLLITGLWLHAWYVTYVSADPPEPSEPVDWRAKGFTVVGVLLGWLLWPFRRRAAADAKSRKKSSDDDAPKRRRKTAAKKRTTRSRTRVKTEDGETADEEEETTDEDESASEEEWTEDDEEETPAPPSKTAPMIAKPQASLQSRPSAPASVKSSPSQSNSSWSNSDDDSEDSDDDDDPQYRVDGAHDGVDPFKGLSKRQRRELKKQMRDQQRQQQPQRGR